MMWLRARLRRPIQFDTDKALRLRRLYLGDCFNMNGPELDKDCNTQILYLIYLLES